jgi:hypothetical protein
MAEYYQPTPPTPLPFAAGGQPPQPTVPSQPVTAGQAAPRFDAPENPAEPADPNATRQQLQQAIAGSNQVLATAKTFIPIFADTLTLDRTKLTLTKRTFFYTGQVMSIRIEDILNVTATIGPIFGSVIITSRVFNNQKPYTINYFSRDNALRMKRITQGYVIALRRKIDCSSLPTSELAKLLDQLGEDDHPGTD